MDKIKAFFEHNGTQYNYWMYPIGKEAIPTYFQVMDENYRHQGDLVLMLGSWHFDNNPEIELILGNYVELWYE